MHCKMSKINLILLIFMVGTWMALLRTFNIHISDAPSPLSKSSFVSRWLMDSTVPDPRYTSLAEIDWAKVSLALEKLNGTEIIGLLNFDESEIQQWRFMRSDAEHIPLYLDYVGTNVSWDSLYPEWIDEEEDYGFPKCPKMPKIEVPSKPRLDVVAVKLPCQKSQTNWSRDIARLHLQLAAATVAASVKSYHSMYVLFVTDCWPIPNLFPCKELVSREGNLWLYLPDPIVLRQKLQLPPGSCELAVPLAPKDQAHAHFSREAYATILHSASFYVCGAIVAAQSIRMSGSTRDLVILVDDTISEDHRQGLKAAGWKIYPIERIRNPKAERDAYNEWNYSKFRLWQLTNYDKIIFIDADMLVEKNIDFLSELPEISAIGNNGTLFNSGVMVIEPSNCTFELLMSHMDEIESYNGGDQGYLNEVFTWWHRIPKRMNFLKHFWEGDDVAIKNWKTELFGADPPALYVIHYLGNKPWMCFRDYDCNWNVDRLQEFASDVAHRRWWRVHDGMDAGLQHFCLLRSKQKAALEWDRREAQKANYSDAHWNLRINDTRLTICFEKFCFWESMLWHWGEANYTDNATSITPTL